VRAVVFVWDGDADRDMPERAIADRPGRDVSDLILRGELVPDETVDREELAG
jgi:hypothetical protein